MAWTSPHGPGGGQTSRHPGSDAVRSISFSPHRSLYPEGTRRNGELVFTAGRGVSRARVVTLPTWASVCMRVLRMQQSVFWCVVIHFLGHYQGSHNAVLSPNTFLVDLVAPSPLVSPWSLPEPGALWPDPSMGGSPARLPR
ncbi:hypothetical protein E2I00_007713 [Balaenoptera physalus]|uniref:Uncharacterized protein n=1 Tax=Balaenoptera physalus TaxID=9770 RepID=A0A6A1QFI4_BALPH|nr:hypothetical protein E2I00_007713 [Balaenoptera physalus]